MSEQDCLFCKIIAGKIPAKKAYEDDKIVAFHDISPKAPTHILVCPKKHIERVSDMKSGDIALVGEVVFRAQEIAKELGLKEGFRLVFNNGAGAGQAVWHIHLHLMGGRVMHWPPG